jgi:hypothetical protein
LIQQTLTVRIAFAIIAQQSQQQSDALTGIGEAMSDWKKEFNEEQRLQHQYDEWYEREQQKGQQAIDQGDFTGSRKHFDNAERIRRMGENSADRMEKLVPDTSSGCLLSLMLLPFHLLMRLFFRH